MCDFYKSWQLLQNQCELKRNFTLVKINMCGFINILSQALYNLFLSNQLMCVSIHSSLWN